MKSCLRRTLEVSGCISQLPRYLLLIVLGSLTGATQTTADPLDKPLPILSAGNQIDVERWGHAAPFVADWDGDGRKDLLVGEFFQGRLRIYRNAGTNERPEFHGFSLFMDGAPTGCIPAVSCMGFGPQLVDLDNDGHRDIISGSWPQKMFIFRGLPGGLFAPGVTIMGTDGEPLAVEYGSTVFAADWDADGDLDLLVGASRGMVHWARNTGVGTFESPQPLVAAGEAICCNQDAGPVAVDWDGDGDLDLLLGTGDGSVLFYCNDGARTRPELSAPTVLIPAPVENEPRGKRAKICVTDWNEDGRLDIVLGDAGESFEKQLSDQEEVWCELARAEQANLLTQWATVFQEYRALLAASEKEQPASARQLSELREKLETLHAARERAFHEAEGLAPGKQRHGRLWLFLGRVQQPNR